MSAPRSLPGLVWDPVRNRYFPASSKPPPPSPPPPPPISARARQPRSLWQSIHGLGHVERLRDPNRQYGPHLFLSLIHIPICISHLLTQHYAESTSVKEQRVPIFGAIRNFTVSAHDNITPSKSHANQLFITQSASTVFGRNYCLVGDDRGWIYSLHCAEDDDATRRWAVEFKLGADSEVRYTYTSAFTFHHFLTDFFTQRVRIVFPVRIYLYWPWADVSTTPNSATSFGPSSEICIRKVDNPEYFSSSPSLLFSAHDVFFYSLSFILRTKLGHDIRCADFANTDEIILGTVSSLASVIYPLHSSD
jgi:hypothetical protein